MVAEGRLLPRPALVAPFLASSPSFVEGVDEPTSHSSCLKGEEEFADADLGHSVGVYLSGCEDFDEHGVSSVPVRHSPSSSSLCRRW